MMMGGPGMMGGPVKGGGKGMMHGCKCGSKGKTGGMQRHGHG
jgi:hypothetical protein